MRRSARIRLGAALTACALAAAFAHGASAQTPNLRREILESQRRLEEVRAERVRLQGR